MRVGVEKLRILSLAPLLLAAGAGSGTAQDSANVKRICLAPAEVEASASSDAAINAVREAFSSYLTGPTLRAQTLQARLASQARLQAQQAGTRALTVQVTGQPSESDRPYAVGLAKIALEKLK